MAIVTLFRNLYINPNRINNRNYLCIPATNVYSESVFKQGSDYCKCFSQ